MTLFKKKKSKDLELQIKRAVKFEPTIEQGLSTAQINERIEKGLVNKTTKTVTKSYFEIIFKNVFSILNIILFTIAITMMAFGLYARLLFLGILSVNLAISLFQDIKARRLVDKLSLISNPRALAVRNGAQIETPFNELVLSDVVVLKAGNTIPCDSTVIHGEISVNESLLTGENNDIKKQIGDKIYAESVVTSGIAYAIIEKVGKANYVSKLQEKAKEFSRPKSEILTTLTNVIKAISIAAIAIGIAEIITYLTLTKDVKDSVDKMTSSVVAMIPIGMYLMTSITLTIGVIILARRRILVRELYSIEMLARVNVLCLDKTGTLTDGKMKVNAIVPLKKHTEQEIEEMISVILSITQDDNITAKALKERFSPKTIYGNVASIPFNSKRKYSAVSHEETTYVMGAFGFIKISNAKEISPLVHKYEEMGRRVMVVVKGKGNIVENKLPTKLEAVGVIVLEENIKNDAIENIEWFKNNDVSVRIISGDSLVSLQSIAKRVGVNDYDKAISLEGLSDKEVKKAAKQNFVFARVSPEQKKIIIEELRKDNCVAMVGDGVNDLLALKSADCSIAMASGSDAAKAASHLVSLDSNFSSLPKVVEEGRKVINNLQRVCSIFLVKTMFAITLSSVFLIMSWFNHGVKYPFSANSLYVWELITIGIAPFFVALEPNKERLKGRFTSNVFRECVPAALTQLIVCFALYIAFSIDPKIFPSESPIDGATGGVVGMSVIVISCMSLVIFAKICMPLNKFRGAIVLAAAALIAVFFGLDYYLTTAMGKSILKIDYSTINTAAILLGSIAFVLGIPMYFGISWITGKVLNRKKKKRK